MDSRKSNNKSSKNKTGRSKKKSSISGVTVFAIVLVIASAIGTTIIIIKYLPKSRLASVSGSYTSEIEVDPAAKLKSSLPEDDGYDTPAPEKTDASSPTPEQTETPAPTPVNTAETTVSPTPSSTPESSEAPEDYSFSVAELNAGAEYNLCGHSVSYKRESVGNGLFNFIFSVDGTTKKISNCYAAYGVTFASGAAGVVVGTSDEQNTILTYSVSDGSMSECSRYSNASLTGIEGDTFVVTESIDCFGTWEGRRTYSISEQLRLKSTTSRLDITGEYYTGIELYVKHDISAKTSGGDSILLAAGKSVRIKYVKKGINNTACLYDSDGTQYLVERINGTHGYEVATPDGNLSEYDCFDNMPYSG